VPQVRLHVAALKSHLSRDRRNRAWLLRKQFDELASAGHLAPRADDLDDTGVPAQISASAYRRRLRGIGKAVLFAELAEEFVAA